MFNRKNKYILAISLVLFIISFGFGYFIMDNNINKDNNKILAVEPNVNEEIPDIEIIKEENRISPNTFIEERIHYKECGHLISNITLAKDDIVNMTKDELIEYLYSNSSNFRLISFSNVKIVLWGEKNYLCPDHYIVSEENGKIAIFKIDEFGERILEKVYVEYPINILKAEDQQKLKEGIIVDSIDELSNILENFIS